MICDLSTFPHGHPPNPVMKIDEKLGGGFDWRIRSVLLRVLSDGHTEWCFFDLNEFEKVFCIFEEQAFWGDLSTFGNL